MIAPLKLWLIRQEHRFLPGQSLGARFARGTFWMIIGTVLINILAMFGSVISARLLGKDGFGALGMVTSTIGMFAVYAALGIGMTATRHVAQWRCADPVRAGRVMAMLHAIAAVSGTIVALVVYVSAPRLAEHTLHAPALELPLRLGCLQLLFHALNTALAGALSGLESFRQLTRISFLQGLINFPLMVAGVWLFGLPGAVGALVAVSCCTWLFNLLTLRRECTRADIPLLAPGDWGDISIIWRFSLPLVAGSVLASTLTWYVNTLLIARPVGYEDMALVNAANQWRIAILTLPGIFCSTALPILSAEQKGTGGGEGYRLTMDLTVKIAILAVLPAFTLVAFGSDLVLRLYGDGFRGGAPAFIVLSAAAGLAALSGSLGTGITALGRPWASVSFNAAWGVLLLVLAVKLVPGRGPAGYAASMFCAGMLLCVLSATYLRASLYPATVYRVLMAIASLGVLAATCYGIPTPDRLFWLAPMLIVSSGMSLLILGRDARTRIYFRLRRSVDGGGYDAS